MIRTIRTKAFATFGALAVLAAAGCSADRSAPVAPESAALVPAPQLSADALSLPGVAQTTPGSATSILRKQPLAADVTVSRVIGADGGTIEIPAAGLRVYVPRGALKKSTTITATALKGDMVAYEFGPHGTRFALPLVMSQATEGTNAASLPAGTLLHLGYFTDPGALDRSSKRAQIAELISGLALVTNDAVVFPVWHFSGYAVVWGFHGNDQGHDDQGRDDR
jgi:hypothetical protein